MEKGYSSKFLPDYSVFPPLMSTQAFSEVTSPLPLISSSQGFEDNSPVGFMDFLTQSPPTSFDSDFFLKTPKTEPDQHFGISDDLQYPNPKIPSPSKTNRFHESPPSNSSSATAAIKARKRRKTISENIRALEKLMPWETKMNIATMLTEAYKYIKFLQAQVNVLQSMPYYSLMVPPTPTATTPSSSSTTTTSCANVLEKLNRQQLLRVLVNSPAAQTTMSSQGNCVYSLEQLWMFEKKLAEQMKKKKASVSH